MPRLPTQSKYRAIRTEVDGISFASRREAHRYKELRIFEKAGRISGLELQPRYPLVVNGVKVGTYVGDFRYTEAGDVIVEDAKGVLTGVYRLKRALMEACYGIKIRET